MKNLTSFGNFANVCLRFLMWRHRAVQNRNILFHLLLSAWALVTLQAGNGRFVMKKIAMKFQTNLIPGINKPTEHEFVVNGTNPKKTPLSAPSKNVSQPIETAPIFNQYSQCPINKDKIHLG